MAYTNAPAVIPTSGGVLLAPITMAAAGNSFYNDGRTTVIFENTNGSGSVNLTFDTPVTVDSLAVPNPVVALAFGTRKVFRFPTNVYNQPDGGTDAGMVHVDVSANAGITMLIIQ